MAGRGTGHAYGLCGSVYGGLVMWEYCGFFGWVIDRGLVIGTCRGSGEVKDRVWLRYVLWVVVCGRDNVDIGT